MAYQVCLLCLGGLYDCCGVDSKVAGHGLLGRYTVRLLASLFAHPKTYLTELRSSWSFYVPMFGTLVNLGLLYWKRHSVPLNYVLLSTFTLLEAFTLGIMTAFFDSEVVLQAL